MNPEEVSQVLDQQYGISATVHPFEAISSNQNFIANDNTGRKYFVKTTNLDKNIRFRGDQEGYSTRIALVSELRKQGIQVPMIIETKPEIIEAGNPSLYTKEGNYGIEVHEFIPNSEDYSGKEGQLPEVGRQLAKQHIAFDKIAAENGSVARYLSNVGGIHEGKAKKINFFDSISRYQDDIHKIPDPLLRESMYSLLPELMEAYHNLKGLNTSELDRGLVHGDFHQGQMLFSTKDPSKFLAALDWEGACTRLRAFDIGYALDRAAIPINPVFLKTQLERPLKDFSHDKRRVEGFLEAYTKIRHFSDDNLRAIATELQKECVNRSAGFIQEIYRATRDPENNPNFNFKKLHGFMRIMSPKRMGGLAVLLE